MTTPTSITRCYFIISDDYKYLFQFVVTNSTQGKFEKEEEKYITDTLVGIYAKPATTTPGLTNTIDNTLGNNVIDNSLTNDVLDNTVNELDNNTTTNSTTNAVDNNTTNSLMNVLETNTANTTNETTNSAVPSVTNSTTNTARQLPLSN